jgi:hypothetical protein
MSKYSKEIADLATTIESRDMSMHELLSEIKKIQKNLESDLKEKAYKLPYSSNPKPFGKPWRKA